MNYALSPAFIAKLKKLDVRVRNNFKRQLLVFVKDHNNPQLNNHPLREDFVGYRSINVTNDYRAIYEEMIVNQETIAYFIDIDTHEELYGRRKKAA